MSPPLYWPSNYLAHIFCYNNSTSMLGNIFGAECLSTAKPRLSISCSPHGAFSKNMKKILSITLCLFYLSGCSMFAPRQQKISIRTNVPTSAIYINGELVQVGQQAEFLVKRNYNAQIMVTAEGYYPAYRQLISELSTLGILDIVGGIILIVPLIGLAFPGAKSLDYTNVAIHLVPQPKSQELISH